jgi:hypothetical protein
MAERNMCNVAMREMKPANKAERSATELAEPRAGTNVPTISGMRAVLQYDRKSALG